MEKLPLKSSVVALLLTALLPLSVQAAAMNDYCIKPPFIQSVANPNLLLLIDNSASMFDLAYDDLGMKHCSITTAKDCTADPSVCGAADGTCTAFDRRPRYCYDETYTSANAYVGYFNRFQADGTSTQFYSYDFTNKLFKPVSAITTDASGATVTCNNTGNNRYVAGQLCLVIDGSKNLTTLTASGNYLNWLTASKFDVEKQVLTGGKYVSKVCANDKSIACSVDADCNLYGTNYGTCGTVAGLTPFMMPESRGCAGQDYIKDANVGDFVNYTDAGSASVASLGITFTVSGPKNSYSSRAPSMGGQTYLSIFEGDSSVTYNYYACQQAVTAIATGGNADIKKWTDLCLGSSTKAGYCDKTQGVNLVPTWTTGTVACSGSTDCMRDPTVAQASKVCSLGTNIICTTDANCSTAAGTFCSGQPSRSCTGVTDTTSCKVTTPAVNGTCTANLLSYCKKGTSPCQPPVKAADVKQVGDVCASDASCSNWKGVATDWVAQAGACTGYSPAVTNDYGPCTVQAAANYGTCVANDLGPCVLPAGQAAAKTNVVFQQSMQECWTIRPAATQTPPQYGFSNMNTVKQQCPDVYASWKSCSNNVMTQCSVDSDCGSGNTCRSGPAAVGPGNPAYLCGLDYAGQCFVGSGTSWALKGGSPACQDFPNQSDYASVDIWKQNSLAYQFWTYCNDMLNTTPVVTDPTNPPSDTTIAGNLPPILSGISVVSQLGKALATIPVRVSASTVPTGVIQDNASKIRMGVMAFNNFGSSTESATLGVKKVCSNDSRIICTTNVECGGGTTECKTPTGADADLDGAKMLHYVGQGTCLASPATPCSTAAQCTAGDVCVSSGIGDHTTGMIKTIDSIRAATWTPFAEAFYNTIGYFAKDPNVTSGKSSRTDLRLSSSDFLADMNPSENTCQANNVLLITDGGSTADQNGTVGGLVNVYKSVTGNITGTCTYYSGSKNLDDLTWLAHNRNIKSFTTGSQSATTPASKSERVNTYVVFNGTDNGSNEDDCNNVTMLTKAASNGGTNMFRASDPSTLGPQLKRALAEVAAGTASGTAASILSNSEGSGANILQAVFNPYKEFENNTKADWIGEMQNLWYFVDPLVNNSTIREDSITDKAMYLNEDNVLRFAFDNTAYKTMVQRYSDSDGDGVVTDADKVGGLIDPDDIKSLWRAGKLLWSRDISSSGSPRKIYTTIDGASLMYLASATYPGTLDGNPVPSTAATLAPYLNVADAATAGQLINWVHGEDLAGCADMTQPTTPRCRTIDIKNTSGTGTTRGTWRLGDIISSTPRVESTVRLNTYDLAQPGGYSDTSYLSYITSSDYKNRGVAFVGANDGMLHAFNLGILDVKAQGFKKASLGGTDLGKELWSFIPKNALPYLQYMAEPAYGHLYYVDGRTLIFDASIGDINSGDCVKSTYWRCAKPSNGVVVTGAPGSSLDATKNTWRTIVLGGMGIGGASTVACASGSDCVQTPRTDPADATKGLGYSSYFALDVTNPTSPQILWEFTDPDLGYSTTGPAVIRLGDPKKNGRWFAVFGSGPTGPIDTSTNQFKGASNQPLKFFVVDLRTGDLVKTITTTINNAFAGSMISAPIDADRWNSGVVGNYQDDALYVGYVKADSDGKPLDGGVGRILIDPIGAGVDPSNANVANIWHWSPIYDGIGPVTTSIARLQDRKNRELWLFFGTGRYYYRANASIDDFTSIRKLFGIKEPCYNKNGIGNYLDHACSDPISGAPVDQTSSISAITSSNSGWQITLDSSTADAGSERVVTDTVALPNGTLFFTTFKPTADICGYGGNSFLWGLNYNSGGAAAANALKGKALIQLSTGEFKEVDLATAFTDKLNRRMATPMTGKPPTDAPPIVSNSSNKPIKKILHIQER